MRDFTPASAPSWTEQAVIEEHWPLKHDEFVVGRSFSFNRFLQVIILSRDRCHGQGLHDDCNLMLPKYWSAIGSMEKMMAEDITVVDGNDTIWQYDNEVNQSSSLCLSFWGVCHRTARQDGPLSILQDKAAYEKRGIKVGYPIVEPKEGSNVYLGFNLGGVGLDANGTIDFVASFRFVYYLRSDSDRFDHLAGEWEKQVDVWMTDAWPKTEQYKLLDVTYLHSRSITNGLKQSSAALVPRFSITFAVLALFCVLNLLETRRDEGSFYTIDWVKSKPWLTGAGLLTALFGIISGIGLMQWAGADYNDVVSICPFVVISVGVDDMFILVAGWHGTDYRQSVTDRMGHALGDAAVAITITSITSALSFAVGAFTTIHSVQLFCMYAAICISFNYLYQITFFVSIMVYFGHLEDAQQNSVLPCLSKCRRSSDHQINDAKVDKPPKTQTVCDHAVCEKQTDSHEMLQIAEMMSKTSKPTRHPSLTEKSVDGRGESFIETFFNKYYGPALLHPVVKVLVALFYVAYIGGAIYGVANLKEGLEFERLLLEDDPTVLHINRTAEYLQQGTQAEIVFNNPGDITKDITRRKINQIVDEFETGSGLTLGKKATQFWMRAYLQYRRDVIRQPSESNDVSWITDVRSWSKKYTYYQTWGKDVAWDYKSNRTSNPHGSCDQLGCMSAFRFRVALEKIYYGEDHVKTALVFREIAARHKEFNITTYNSFRQLADQILVVLPNTVQNVIIAIACMAVISLIFIPNPICTVWITVALISIDIGVAGYLFLWDINLDQISMINIIMSIGFSIDCTAHIIYGFVNASDAMTPDEKCVDSMKKLAWPVFQGGLSTILGTSVLTFVHSYMILAFFKCVFLVITFGVAHALIFLPVLLSTAMPIIDRCWMACTVKKVSRRSSCA